MHADGGSERVCDPGNPLRAPGAFGEKSVLLLAGYEPPAWLAGRGRAAGARRADGPGRGLGAEVDVRVWSPADAEPARAAAAAASPTTGPEYDELAGLTRFAAADDRAPARCRAHRVALLAPGDRNEWYSASARYAGALVPRRPAGDRAAPSRVGAPVGMGASLGALAMLHAQRRHPGTFGGLFLQSGSFFTPRFDAQERGFPRFARIARFVRERCASGRGTRARARRAHLRRRGGEHRTTTARWRGARRQGYDAALHEVPDLHNYTAWRDAFDPHLTELLAARGERSGTRAVLAGDRRDRRRRRLRPLGPAVPGVPGRARRRLGVRGPRHGRRRRASCSTPAA